MSTNPNYAYDKLANDKLLRSSYKNEEDCSNNEDEDDDEFEHYNINKKYLINDSSSL